MIDKDNFWCGIIVAIFILITFTGVGFVAGEYFEENQSKQTIVAEISDGGFVLEDEHGEKTIVYWENNHE